MTSHMERALSYPSARSAYARGEISEAELTAVYVSSRVLRAKGPRFLQATRVPRLGTGKTGSFALSLVAEREIHGLPRAAATALVGFGEGTHRAELFFHIPSSRELCRLQARGWRCVSLLEDDALAAPHKDGLAFAIHDLCHLEKFMSPVHHEEQVGFFASLDRTLDHPRFVELEASFSDDAWVEARDRVIADMNGSSAFLFASLKYSLRKVSERHAGVDFEEVFELLLSLFDFDADEREAARVFGSRHDEPSAAERVVDRFRAVGRAALTRSRAGS